MEKIFCPSQHLFLMNSQKIIKVWFWLNLIFAWWKTRIYVFTICSSPQYLFSDCDHHNHADFCSNFPSHLQLFRQSDPYCSDKCSSKFQNHKIIKTLLRAKQILSWLKFCDSLLFTCLQLLRNDDHIVSQRRYIFVICYKGIKVCVHRR